LIGDSDNGIAARAVHGTSRAHHATSEVTALVTALEERKAIDQTFMARAHPLLRCHANHVGARHDGDGGGDDDAPDAALRVAHELRRRSGSAVTLTAEYIYAALLSSRGADDLRKCNPFLDDATLEQTFDLAVAIVLNASRVGHVNRCLAAARELRALLRKATTALADTTDAATAARARDAMRARRPGLALKVGCGILWHPKCSLFNDDKQMPHGPRARR
jgi:hypothetical protein